MLKNTRIEAYTCYIIMLGTFIKYVPHSTSSEEYILFLNFEITSGVRTLSI